MTTAVIHGTLQRLSTARSYAKPLSHRPLAPRSNRTIFSFMAPLQGLFLVSFSFLIQIH